LGTTLNIALPPGSDEHAVLASFNKALLPAMQRFRPELILVSAGLDAHLGDTLGRLAYTNHGYAQIAAALQAMAKQFTQGRMVWVLEGGYVPQANADAVQAMLHVLSGS